ncbi:unnamed protein product [Rotaria sp. Silwood1]|nr:unnamed protein product [Rotaria sp. Silwood1]CAF1649538.1 unnamed protein product [Rotaria sp. Silwood1]CAF3823378.1 unnamed protein product [Rotaria sp. Silwood1]CAF3841051.1 unnamed protein product [Rotaria sp. Silwood1]CAF4966481.1 unnamed protein product [Rotaria sp. Silwood1]
MFSGSILRLQQLIRTNLRRNLSFKQFNEIKPIISRNLAWFSQQQVKHTFGRKLRRRLRIFWTTTVVGFGAFCGYRGYRNYQWFNEMTDSDETIGTKPRVIVLGTGWGAVPLLKHIDTKKYEVVCISPRNYFLMTPLLLSVSVGTVETRTVVSAIRSLIGPRIKYVEAHCINVDPKAKIISCNTDEEPPVSRGDYVKNILVPSKRERGASSRVIKDSARTRPAFDMQYDILVVAIGSGNNTFNISGVEEHAHFLKEILDARRIRSALSDAFESSMTPTQTAAEKKRLLHFVIVGGGPTGVEFAAELADLVREDLQSYFPRLVANDVKITLIEALDHILSTMDKQISDYTERHFHRENIEVLTNTFVKEVKQQEIVVHIKDTDEVKSIPCSIVVWATGIKARPLTNRIRETIGLDIQSNRKGLLTDQYLRVKGIDDGSIYAIGDCATIQQPKLVDRIQSLFEEADTENRGALSLQQFETLVKQKISQFPQSIEKAFAEADKEKSGYLTLATLRLALEKADQKIRTLPATAQVASQQGRYVADLLNQLTDLQSTNFEQQKLMPFRYKHMGSLAYVGGDEAVVDLTGSKTFQDLFSFKSLSGRSAAYLWKSFYFTEMFTARTKTLLAVDWIRNKLFGRDISRY